MPSTPQQRPQATGPSGASGPSSPTPGTSPTGPTGQSYTAPDKYIVFLSHAEVNGAMGGLEGADVLCQNAAAAAALPGEYIAFLSLAGHDPLDRIAVDGPWHQVESHGVIESAPTFVHKPMLMSGGVRAMLQDEEGRTFPYANNYVWTAPGHATTNDCGGWASDSYDLKGEVAHLESQSDAPSFGPSGGSGPYGCDTTTSIICLQIR